MTEHTAQTDTLLNSIRALSKYLGRPVVLVASHWLADRRVDLDEQALPILDAVLPAITNIDMVMVCLGRGGHLAFADGLRRRLMVYDHVTTCALDLVNGVMSMAMLMGHGQLYRKQAGLGAYDVGSLGGEPPKWQAHLLPFVDQTIFNLLDREQAERVALRLAHTSYERQQALYFMQTLSQSIDASEDVLKALSFESLGTHQGLDPNALARLKINAKIATSSQQSLLDDIYLACDALLTLRSKPESRFSTVDLIDEVEFDLNSTYPGAIFASSQYCYVYQLDSGSPDPDTGILKGQWVSSI